MVRPTINSLLPALIGLAIGIAFFATLSVLSFQGKALATYPIAPNSVPTLRLDLNQCTQRLYFPTGNIHSCPAQETDNVTITQAVGFAPACYQMYGQHGIQYRYGTTYDFVLMPNSSAYLTVNYTFIGSDSIPASFFSNETYDVYLLDSNGSSWVYLPANETSLKVSATANYVTELGKTMELTYTITTTNTRTDEIGKTFLIPVYGICTGELVTIGDRPYTSSLPLG